MINATLGPPELLNAFIAAQGEPTRVQFEAWKAIQKHHHLLISAPTGSGKTWAALMPLLADLALLPSTRTTVLWISPLKALVADLAIRISTFITLLQENGAQLPAIRVSARTGDISARQRARDNSHPPHIWCVTPESLAIWLTIPAMISRLSNVKWIVVDEVHALASSRRGADLALSIERLDERLAIPARRLGLSATCNPLEATAHFLVGPFRPYGIVHDNNQSALDLAVEYIPEAAANPEIIITRIEKELPHHATILVFTRTRATAEKLVWHCRRTRPDLLVGIHHGSLSSDIRRDTESKMRAGELRLVFSSTSLELGMDIGSVGLVVLVHPPGEVVRLLQRVGRSGHGPYKIRRGLILAGTHAELLEATVTASAGREEESEPISSIGICEDVFCQHLLAESILGRKNLESLANTARRTAPFANLEDKTVEACLAYLRGELGQTTLLIPRLRRTVDGYHHLARQKFRFQIRQSLGAISAQTLRPVVLHSLDSSRLLGEIAPEYADLLKIGDRFLLDGRALQINRLSGPDVEVIEAPAYASPPRWSGELLPLSGRLAHRLQELRDTAAAIIVDGTISLAQWLQNRHKLLPVDADVLANYFIAQDQRSEIPHTNSPFAEISPCEGGWLLALHTPLNRAGNDALARLIARRMSRSNGGLGQTVVADLGIGLYLEELPPEPAAWLRTILSPVQAFTDIALALLPSDMVRRRFQEIATTALMIPRTKAKRAGKAPKVGGSSWVAKRLFDYCLRHDPDFCLIHQARREILETSCDATTALQWLQHVNTLPLRIRRLPYPSPFVQHWTQGGAGPDLAPDSPSEALAKLKERILGAQA